MPFRQCAQLYGGNSSAPPLFRLDRSLVRLGTDDRLRTVGQWPSCAILVPVTIIDVVGTVVTSIDAFYIDAANADIDD